MNIRKAHKWEQVWIQTWEDAVHRVIFDWLGPPNDRLDYLDEWKMTSPAGDILLTLDKVGSRLAADKRFASCLVRFEDPKQLPLQLRSRLSLGEISGRWCHEETPDKARDAGRQGHLTGEWIRRVLSEDTFKVIKESVIR